MKTDPHDKIIEIIKQIYTSIPGLLVIKLLSTLEYNICSPNAKFSYLIG